MIRPVLVHMGMRHPGGGQLSGRMGMLTLHVMRMIVAGPAIARAKVRHQQALTVMPAVSKDVVVLLALRGPLILAQTVPLAMRMLDQQLLDLGSRDDTIPGGFKEEAEMDVHQAIEAEALVNRTDLGQQCAA